MEDKNTENLGTQRLSMRRYLNEFVGLCILLTCSIQMVPDHRELIQKPRWVQNMEWRKKWKKIRTHVQMPNQRPREGKKSKYIRLQHFVLTFQQRNIFNTEPVLQPKNGTGMELIFCFSGCFQKISCHCNYTGASRAGVATPPQG